MFRVSQMGVGVTPPIEYMEVTAGETVVLGEALVLSDGKLTKCGATEKPAYVAVGPVKEGVAPVVKAEPYMTFEVPLAENGAALKLGDQVTIHSDGLQVTATTASGVATIAAIHGTAVGDMVDVHF